MFSFMNPGKSKPAKKGLKIIIVGCGKVGTTLVEQLSKEGHDIIIIDKNKNVKLSDLRYVQVLHYGFDGKVKEGELIVNKRFRT